MAKKVYVGNLSYNASEGEVKSHFSAIGPVEEVILINDRETGRPKGFGFVTFETDEAAATAIATLNEQEFLGRKLRISEAIDKRRSQGQRPQYSGNRY